MRIWVLVILVVFLLLVSSRERFNPATARPSQNDEALVKTVASYTGLSSDSDIPKINKYIASIQSYYDTQYLPDKKTPTADQIKAFTDPITDSDLDKESLGQLIEYVFLSTEAPPPEDSAAPEPAPSDTGLTGGQATGGSSTTSAGPTSGGTSSSTSDRRVWGPEYPGLGEGGGGDGATDTTGSRQYPELIGATADYSTLYPGAGVGAPSKSWQLSFNGSLPNYGSLGSEEWNKYLPFSRVPGDQDLVPNPYSISSTYTTSRYSSKTEPVPFLADFSAFQK
jgi:hypothetical protein